jgi:hypothetical protein
MVLDPKYIADQTWDFPAAAATTNKSSSILVASLNELVGMRWPILEATTNKLGFETTEDALDVLDAAATWDPLEDKAGNAVQVTATYTTAGRKSWDPTTVILGPCRIRLVAFTSTGVTAINQDEQVVIPKFRQF